MTKRELKKQLKALIPEMKETEDMKGNKYFSIYLGSFLSLDPCGRYHHILSLNGATKSCTNFWNRLENAASELNGWIESGKGGALDIYFCLNVD